MPSIWPLIRNNGVPGVARSPPSNSSHELSAAWSAASDWLSSDFVLRILVWESSESSSNLLRDSIRISCLPWGFFRDGAPAWSKYSPGTSRFFSETTTSEKLDDESSVDRQNGQIMGFIDSDDATNKIGERFVVASGIKRRGRRGDFNSPRVFDGLITGQDPAARINNGRGCGFFSVTTFRC